MSKRFKYSTEMMSPSQFPSELSVLTSSGYPRNSFDRLGLDLSAVVFSYLSPGEQIKFRRLNRLARDCMFDETKILILNWTVGRKDDGPNNMDKLVKYYHRNVRKVHISLDDFGLGEINYFLTNLLRGRKPLDILVLHCRWGWFRKDQICNLVKSIDSNFTKELYLDFTLSFMKKTTFELLRSKLGSCLAGVAFKMTSLDYFDTHKNSFRIKKLKIWLKKPSPVDLKKISERFPYLERLYILSNEEFNQIELLIPLSQSYFPNLNYFAFHYGEGEVDVDKGHRMMSSLSKKEFPVRPIIIYNDNTHFVYSRLQKSLWLVTSSYLGFPKLPSFVTNVSFVWSEEKSLLAEEMQAMSILKANPSIEYFRSRDISLSLFFKERSRILKFEAEDIDRIFKKIG